LYSVGGAGPVDEGPVVEVSSSPPTMSTADDEEQHIIKPSIPMMAAWDIYSNLTFFCQPMVKDNHGSL